MNVKSLLLLLAFTGFGVSCNNDDPNGSDGPNNTGERTELQIAFTGTGESQEYDTKATASDSENQIDKLEIYLFAANSDGGQYYFLEKWTDGTAYDPANPGVTNFKKSETGTGWKASLYPGELKGYPYVKLLCIANNGTTADSPFFAEDGTTETVGSVATPLVALTPDQNGDISTADVTTEETFRATYTRNLGADVIVTPLLMTGEGETKIAGSVSKVDITLRRIVARFDIENNVTKSNLTIEKVTLARGRTVGILWDASRTVVGKDATSPFLATYQPVEFGKIPGANTGVTESALYTYPNLDTDESLLILEGTYKSPITSEQVPVTYNVPIVRTAEGDAKGTYIPVMANNRYRLKITDVTQSSVFATFEVVDWISGGGIIVKPNNDAPVFAGAAAFTSTMGGALPQRLTNSAAPEDTSYYDLPVGGMEFDGSFSIEIAATGKVRAEKNIVTKSGDTDWFSIGTPTTEERSGVWYSKFNIIYTGAFRKEPVDVTFINETASYDPALWTTLNFRVPLDRPVLSDGGAGSPGNTTDFQTNPTAWMYNTVGSFIKVKAMCIEGMNVVDLDDELELVGKPVEDGYFSTYTIRVKSTLVVGRTYNLRFENGWERGRGQHLEIIAIANPDTEMTPTLAADAATYASLTGSGAAYAIETNIELLGQNTYTLNIKAPQGATAVLPADKWLTVTEGASSNGITSYTVEATDGVTDYTAFDLVFTNKQVPSESLTITMNKAASKPKLEEVTGQSVFNEAPQIDGDGYGGIVVMYAAEGSLVKVKMTCADAASFTEVPGLTITPEANDIYSITVDANPTFAEGSTTLIEAVNDLDGSLKTTLAITWKDPAIQFELGTGSNSIATISGGKIIVDYEAVSFDNTEPILVKITGYKGSAISYNSANWLNNTVKPTEIAEDGTVTVEYIVKDAGSPIEKTDMEITVTNAIPNGGDKTISLAKLAP